MTPTNYSSTVTIDSGAAALSLPQSVFTDVTNALPMEIDADDNGNLLVACESAELDADLTIRLTGTNGKSVSVNIPMGNLVLPYYKGIYNSTVVEKKCVLALAPGADDGNVSKPKIARKAQTEANLRLQLIGDPFLRSAYVYYNLDQKTISFAQASYNTNASNIVEIGQGSVPALVGSGSSVSNSR